METGTDNAVSACVVARDAAGTLGAALASVAAQTAALAEVIVVDDGSRDETARVAEAAGARVIRFETGRGRGAARAAAVEAAGGAWVLFVDAHNVLAPDFVERALAEATVEEIAGVVGSWHDPKPSGARGRWRARHLYRTGRGGLGRGKTLSTHACLLRKAGVVAAGNFEVAREADEDTELGMRMAVRGGRFVWAERCRVSPQRENTWGELAERHTRWYVRAEESFSVGWYGRWVAYGWRVMAVADWRARDWGALAFTLVLPHWMGWKVWRRAGR